MICLSTLAGILAPLIFLSSMVIIESLQPGYNPVQDMISRLVLGVYGWLETLSFFIVGSLLAVFTLRLYIATLKRITAIVGTAFFSLSSLAFFFLGAFPVDPGKVVSTLHGLIHAGAAAVVVSSFILGCFAFTIYFRVDKKWNKFWLYTVLTAIACLVFSLLWVLSPSEWLWKGLSQRLAAVTGFIWVEVVSVRLLMLCLKKGAK